MKRNYVDAIPPGAEPIPGFPGYFATRAGVIYSDGRGRAPRPLIKGYSVNSCGYPICGMVTPDKKIRWPLVHRIIAQMFVPGDQSLTVNHINMDKRDCRAENLEWVTFSENHRKGHAMKPEWAEKISGRAGRALIATDPTTRAERQFISGKAAAVFVGNAKAAGNISKATRHGRAAYGFLWRKA